MGGGLVGRLNSGGGHVVGGYFTISVVVVGVGEWGSVRGGLGEWWFRVRRKCRRSHHSLEESSHMIEPGLLCGCLRCSFSPDLVSKFRELSGGVRCKLENVVRSRLH